MQTNKNLDRKRNFPAMLSQRQNSNTNKKIMMMMMMMMMINKATLFCQRQSKEKGYICMFARGSENHFIASV
jgi:hypothetical protein